MCIVNYNKSSGFEVVKGVLDRLMMLLGVPSSKDNGYCIRECSGVQSYNYAKYYLTKVESCISGYLKIKFHKLSQTFNIAIIISDATYFPGRAAEVVLRGNVIGKIGVLHPEVITKFDLNNPCAALEISIEPFV